MIEKTDYIVRTATNKDYRDIVELFKDSLTEFELPFVDNESLADITNIEKEYVGKGIFYICLDKQNIVIGTIGLLPTPNDQYKLTKFYISKRYRGMGLGTTLLRKIIAHAKKYKVKKIELETNSKLSGAVSIFEKFGFEKKFKDTLPTACDLYYELEIE